MELSYNYDFLNNIFTDEDFNFLNNYESEIKKLEKSINNQKLKRDEISNFMKYITSQSTDLSNTQLESIVTKSNEMLDLANQNIKDLYTLQNDLISLDKEIIDFILKYKPTEQNNPVFNQEITNMKNRISVSSENFSGINNKVFLNDVKVESFVKQITDSNGFDSVNELHHPEEEPVQNEIYKTYELDQESQVADNNTLLISEKKKTVFLPYTKSEIEQYYKQYSKEYDSFEDVIKKQFVVPISCFSKHPSLARFREGYSLIRDREAKSVFDALKRGIDLMFRDDLYPAVISACKSEDTLDEYIECLENKKLDNFKAFEIKFEVNPMKQYKKNNTSF